MIPILFESDATTYNSNGIGQLHETIDYLVTEVRNGEFELELEYPVEGLWFLELTDSRLILAKPNEIDEEHAFRIYEIVKGLSEQTVTVYASTKTNDLGGNLVKRVVIADETPQQAMTKMKADLVDPTDYNFVSDIQATSSTEWVRKNPLSCISGSDGSLTQYWGGEVKRTNDTIYLYSRRGRDNVTTIRQGKNLEGFTMTTSTKGLITGILPFFTYVDDDGAQITVEGTIVYSPLVNNYPTKHIVPIDYSNDDTVVDLLTLNSAATFYFSYTNPDCDKPKVKLDIDLMQLSDSSEYVKFKDLEKIGLCDTVTVWVEQFDIDVLVKINELTYSGSREQVTRISAGTPSVTFYNDVTNRYMQEISELRKYTEGMEYGVRNLVQLTADSKNRIFRGYTEPSAAISKVDDLWYKDLGSGNVAMLQYDGTTWIDLKITDAVFADEMSVTKFTAGTLNAALVNLINLNASNITTGTMSGVNFWVNLLTGLMRFIDPDSQDTLDFNQAKIIFAAGTNYERILAYTSEGWKLYPGPNNTGTNLNTSLRLHGGVTYVDFIPDVTGEIDESMARARVESDGQQLFLRTAHGKGVSVVDWAGAPRPIKVGSVTIDNATYPTYIWANHWETPRDGNRDLIASPNGTGKFKVTTPEGDAFYAVWASSFDVSSSLEFKKAIEDYTGNATELIETTPVRKYYLNEDVEGVDIKRLGLIVQESPLDIVNTDGGQTIDLYQMTSLLWKSNQELSARLKILENEGVV